MFVGSWSSTSVSEFDKFSDYPSDNCFFMVTPLRTFKVGTPSAKSTAKWLELLSMSLASKHMRSTQKRQAELEKKREKALTNPEQEETKANDHLNPFAADVSSPFEGASPPDGGQQLMTRRASSRQVTAEEELFSPGWQHMVRLLSVSPFLVIRASNRGAELGTARNRKLVNHEHDAQ